MWILLWFKRKTYDSSEEMVHQIQCWLWKKLPGRKMASIRFSGNFSPHAKKSHKWIYYAIWSWVAWLLAQYQEGCRQKLEARMGTICIQVWITFYHVPLYPDRMKYAASTELFAHTEHFHESLCFRAITRAVRAQETVSSLPPVWEVPGIPQRWVWDRWRLSAR